MFAGACIGMLAIRAACWDSHRLTGERYLIGDRPAIEQQPKSLEFVVVRKHFTLLRPEH